MAHNFLSFILRQIWKMTFNSISLKRIPKTLNPHDHSLLVYYITYSRTVTGLLTNPNAHVSIGLLIQTLSFWSTDSKNKGRPTHPLLNELTLLKWKFKYIVSNMNCKVNILLCHYVTYCICSDQSERKVDSLALGFSEQSILGY